MSLRLTGRAIKQLCGQPAYDKGEAIFQAGKVMLKNKDAEASTYDAMVRGTISCAVHLEIDLNGDIEAGCSCSEFFIYDNYCKHIAAVLLKINNFQQNNQLANGIIDLFGNKALRPISNGALFDTRVILDVEFTLKLVPVTYQKYLFGIEVKIGAKRLYIVQKLRELLEHIERREAYKFSKQFTYEPELHKFISINHQMLNLLMEIYQNERMYTEVSSANLLRGGSKKDDRILLIPPFFMDALLPLMAAAPAVMLELGNRICRGIHFSDELPPLQFQFDRDQTDGYQLIVQGLEDIILMESYGIVLHEGKLLKLPPNQCEQLLGLRRMLNNSDLSTIHIPPEQMEPFVEKVIPGLRKLGQVDITPNVLTRMSQPQLKAKLYLDRVKNRLLAGLEFLYGDILIDPFEVTSQKRGSNLILMRDSDRENLILELLEQSSFTKTEGGYFLDDEDSEYNFLYHILPQLEKLVQVYATTAVKERLYTGSAHPKVTVTMADERTDWLDFRFDMDGIRESDIRSLIKSVEEKRKYYRLQNGALLPLESREFQEMIQFMNEVGIRYSDLIGAGVQLPIVRGLHLMDSDRQGNMVTLDKSFRRLLENMRNPDNLDFPVPNSLVHVLRDYQKYGFQWLKTLAHYQFGGILADDMGLGKTIQSIAYIVSELTEIRQCKLPVIIVCPASLVYNWFNELKRFAPEVVAIIVDGNKTERLSTLSNTSQFDVIITSYPLLRMDVSQFAQLAFHTLFLDEAQVFKNHTTQTAQSVKQIQARHTFALTGTPIENSAQELWSIFDVVMPELFKGRKAFNDLSRDSVAKRIRPFLLRRLKTDVLKELPDKIESLQASELLPDQKKLYVAYLAKLQQETLKHLNDKDYQKNRIKILSGLTRLRQLCCHPALFVEGYSGGSAKFEQLLEIVEECRSAGKRMLIFSQFTKMLGLIGRELGLQGVPFFYLDGETPGFERVELCNRFNDGERDLFLISLKAGGTGLNLTGADTVILYDLWWNPAVEQQAADRAHRIGQKKVVQVIRLVTQGTVEDKMYELQQKKKNLIEELIQPEHEALSSLTEQDIREILMI